MAEELGIKHPVDSKTGDPIVMTTDFLLTVDKGQGITVVKAKHSSKWVQHRLEGLSRINGQ
nr:TnsA endonuclease N-terminal domain-containing protein [Bacillus sp. UNC322MFChir4.1]